MLLRDLRSASFRGVPFLVPSDTVEEGRTTLDHLYPDSSFRYAEDNGGIPPEFALSIILAEPNLPAKYRALRAALTRPGPGTLKHPWYGNQFCQLDGKFKVKRDDKHAGYLEIEAKFLVTGPPLFPALVSSGIPAVVGNLASAAVIAIWDAFSRTYSASGVSARTVSSLSDRVVAIGDALVTAFGSASSTPARIVTDAGYLARDAAALGQRMVTSLEAPFDDDTISDAQMIAGFTALNDLAVSMADDADAMETDTLDKAARADLTRTLAAHLEAASFAGLARAMAIAAYATADDVERDEVALADRYGTLQARTLAEAIEIAVRDIHVAAADVLRDSAVRLPRLTTLRVNNYPASVLAYMLYDDDSATQTLVDLNLDQTPVLLGGDVQALLTTD